MPLAGIRVALATVSRPLAGTLVGAGLVSRPLAGTRVALATLSRPLAGTLESAAPASPPAFPNWKLSTGTTAGTSKSVTLPVSVAAGSLIVVAGSAWRSAVDPGPYTVTDTLGTTYTVLPTTSGTAGSGVQRGYLAYGLAPTAGVATVTVTPAASSFLSFGVVELPGAAASPIDATGTEMTGTGGAPAGSVTTLTPDTIVLGLLVPITSGAQANMTPAAGLTQVFENEDTATAPWALVWKRAPSAGVHAVTWAAISPAWRVLPLAVKGP